MKAELKQYFDAQAGGIPVPPFAEMLPVSQGGRWYKGLGLAASLVLLAAFAWFVVQTPGEVDSLAKTKRSETVTNPDPVRAEVVVGVEFAATTTWRAPTDIYLRYPLQHFQSDLPTLNGETLWIR